MQASSVIYDPGDGSGPGLRMGYWAPGDFGYIIASNTGIAGKNLILQLNSGNVGIGTTNPQHLLHVAGTIGAEEVLVTSTGADYVFQPGYRLKPLTEIARYIEANRHLPDMPPSEEVRRKGLGVGEMEAKLLAKIEELTLLMIQEHDRNDALEQQNHELQERMMRLETRDGSQERR